MVQLRIKINQSMNACMHGELLWNMPVNTDDRANYDAWLASMIFY